MTAKNRTIKTIIVDFSTIFIIYGVLALGLYSSLLLANSAPLPDDIWQISNDEVLALSNKLPLLYFGMIAILIASVLLSISVFSASRLVLYKEKTPLKIKPILKISLIGQAIFIPCILLITIASTTLVSPMNVHVSIAIFALTFAYASAVFPLFCRTNSFSALFDAYKHIEFRRFILLFTLLLVFPYSLLYANIKNQWLIIVFTVIFIVLAALLRQNDSKKRGA